MVTPIISHTVEYNSVRLNGTLYSVKNVVAYRNLARIENRVVIGNPSKDDDELLSTKVYDDFSGGCGVYDENEGADTGVFWDAEGLDIDHPSQLALLNRIQSFTISGTNAFVLGGHLDTYVYVSYDKNIYQFDDFNDTMADTTYDLANNPVNESVSFDTKLWVPQGANGYQYFVPGSGVTTPAGASGITAVGFTVYDSKLYCIETDGQLSYYNPLSGLPWVSPTTAKLDSSQVVTNIVTYFNRGDEPAVYVLTTGGIWGYDDVTQTFKQTSFKLPRHPDNGRGVVVFRSGEALNIAAEFGVYAWSGPGGTASPIGLDRKQGVPLEYQGAIVHLAATNNHLWALVKASGSASYHSLYRYNTQGWCRVWSNANKTDTINWVMASDVNSTQRIWWDTGNKIYTMELPRRFSNQREIVANNVGNYGTSGYMITSWFDAGFQRFYKLWNYVATNALYATTLGRSVNTYYQNSKTATSWTSFGTGDTGGDAILDFSTQSIRFKFLLQSDDSTKSPLLDSAVLKFMKIPTSYGTWNITFDLTKEGMEFDRDAQQLADDLESLMFLTTTFIFIHNGRQFRVRVSNLQGWDSTGEDRRKSRTATLVEVPYYNLLTVSAV